MGKPCSQACLNLFSDFSNRPGNETTVFGGIGQNFNFEFSCKTAKTTALLLLNNNI